MPSTNSHINIRRPFRVNHLPLIPTIYKIGYDNKSLTNPPLIDGFRTPFKLLSTILLRRIEQKFYFIFNNRKLCSINSSNTQYHSIYFDRFINNGYEPEVCALLDILLPSSGVFYDIGSNWGFFCGYVASREDFIGTILAFEPQSDVYNDLTKFISEAGLERRVIPYNIALSDENSVGKMIVPDRMHSGLGRLVTSKEDGTVRIARLDDLKITPPELIKIDAEGSELKILMGGNNILRKYKPYLIYENHNYDNNGIHAYLVQHDYIVFSLNAFVVNRSQESILVNIQLNELRSGISFSSKNCFACPRDKIADVLERIKK